MDLPRCQCPDPGCPIHGGTTGAPRVVWWLTYTDKQWLRTLRIDPEDGPAIQETRQQDEDRFRP